MSTHEIRIQLPLPADLFGALLEVVDARWPGARLGHSDGRHAIVIVDTGDRAGEAAGGDAAAAPVTTTDGDAPSVEVTSAGADGVTMAPPPEIVAFLVAAFRDVLDAHDAPNYVEMSVVDAETGGAYTITIGRPDGATPHQLRVAAEERAAAAVELLEMWRRGNHIYRRTHPREWVWVDSAASQDSGETLAPHLAALLDEIDPDTGG